MRFNPLQFGVVRAGVTLVVLLVIWDLAIRIFGIPPYLIPAPRQVLAQLISQFPMLARQCVPTLYATLGGFALSIVFGISVSILIAYSRTLESYVYPLLVFSQSIPKVAIAPLFVVWFGFGLLPKVIAAFMIGFFPVVVSAVMGLKSVEPDLVDLARSMGAGRWKTFIKINLPCALPAIFGGLKVCITLTVVGAIVGEFVGSNSGIGYVLQKANGDFDLPLMFAALVLLSLIGMVLFAAIDVIERLVIPWHVSQRTGLDATA
ncbi:MAG: ABC transporter permease [Burkholderiaceae bacterium]|jgi:NitT/TauT family transport system permease protein